MATFGILGSGSVGQTLAGGLARHGHHVMIGSGDEAKRAKLGQLGPGIQVGTFEEAARFGSVVVLAVKGTAAESALSRAGFEHLTGKVIIDATNPIAEIPPVNGVLRYFTTLDESLMERLQRLVPAARFVKAFSSVGAARMVNPSFEGGRPSMFICGNDPEAKSVVRGVLDQFGWDTEDMGSVEAARAIEPLAMLWCIPGLRENRWTHAFKLLTK